MRLAVVVDVTPLVRAVVRRARDGLAAVAARGGRVLATEALHTTRRVVAALNLWRATELVGAGARARGVGVGGAGGVDGRLEDLGRGAGDRMSCRSDGWYDIGVEVGESMRLGLPRKLGASRDEEAKVAQLRGNKQVAQLDSAVHMRL